MATVPPGAPAADDSESVAGPSPRGQGPTPKLKLVSRWEAHDPLRGDFRQSVATDGYVLRLTREAKISATQRYLAIQVSRQPGNSPSQIEVRLNAGLVASFAAPECRPDAPADVRLIPLESFQGQTVQFEVRQIPQSDSSALEWHFLDFQETGDAHPLASSEYPRVEQFPRLDSRQAARRFDSGVGSESAV